MSQDKQGKEPDNADSSESQSTDPGNGQKKAPRRPRFKLTTWGEYLRKREQDSEE